MHLGESAGGCADALEPNIDTDVVMQNSSCERIDHLRELDKGVFSIVCFMAANQILILF